MINKLNQIYNMFSDELSKELYRLRVNWLMTGKHEYIEKIVELSHPEFPVWNSRDEKEFLDILPRDRKIVFMERVLLQKGCYHIWQNRL